MQEQIRISAGQEQGGIRNRKSRDIINSGGRRLRWMLPGTEDSGRLGVAARDSGQWASLPGMVDSGHCCRGRWTVGVAGGDGGRCYRR